jgi:DNA-binding NtrC family response regulator
MNRILLLDPQSPVLRRISELLAANDYDPVPVEDLAVLRSGRIQGDIVVATTDHLPEVAVGSPLPFILVDENATIRRAVDAIRNGALDYLPAEWEPAELLEVLDRALGERKSGSLTDAFPMVGMSQPMKTLFDTIAKVAPTESTVLITGESGTGKELVARALHSGSRRRHAPLISLNCATVPDHLVEDELFGDEAAASGGLIASAAGGTLFLDEIGDLPAAAQSRLLKALEEEQDIRLIAATHRDLARQVESGGFRDDLYYRLKVIAMTVPPLRDRGEDVLLLANAFLSRMAAEMGKAGLRFAEACLEDMRSYPWPGNVRELENAVQRAVILSDSAEVETQLLAIEPPKVPAAEAAPNPAPDQTIEDYFVSFVTAHQDTMTETELAEKLGISRKSLWERRQRLNIPRKKTKKRGRRRDVS